MEERKNSRSKLTKSKAVNIGFELRRLRIILEEVLDKIEFMLKSMSDARRVSLLEKHR